VKRNEMAEEKKNTFIDGNIEMYAIINATGCLNIVAC
jgi:hypothetical protein